jgi:molecular chaperone IbpA
MRTNLGFSPLCRSSIGFDRIFSLLENANHLRAVNNLPLYNIAKTGEDAYRITIAVAGFAEDELSVAYEPNLLVVSGTKPENDEAEYLHHAPSNRSFTPPLRTCRLRQGRRCRARQMVC